MKAEKQIRVAIAAGQGKAHFVHAEYNIASAYALMGRNRSALEWFQRKSGRWERSTEAQCQNRYAEE